MGHLYNVLWNHREIKTTDTETSKIHENKKCVYATFSVNKVEIRINN